MFAVPVFNVPVMFTPVLVIVTTLALPVTLIVILPFAIGADTLLLPFATVIPVISEPLPTK